MRVACPACRTELNLPDEAAGKNARCPSCRTVFPVDAAAVTVAVPPPRTPVEIEADDGVFVRRRPARSGVSPWVWVALCVSAIGVVLIVIFTRPIVVVMPPK